MSPWLRVVEAYLVQALLRTPAFHRAVEKVVKGVHRVRHGVPPEEMGGTKIDRPGESGFMQHFVNEVKSQITGAETKQTAGVHIDRRVMDPAPRRGTTGTAGSQGTKGENTGEERGAEAVWAEARTRAAGESGRQGFMGEYIGALKDQLRNGKSGR